MSPPATRSDAGLERRIRCRAAGPGGLVLRERRRQPVRHTRLGQQRAAVVPRGQRRAEGRDARHNGPPGVRGRQELHVGANQHPRPVCVPLRAHRSAYPLARWVRAYGRPSGCCRRTMCTVPGPRPAKSTSSKPSTWAARAAIPSSARSITAVNPRLTELSSNDYLVPTDATTEFHTYALEWDSSTPRCAGTSTTSCTRRRIPGRRRVRRTRRRSTRISTFS